MVIYVTAEKPDGVFACGMSLTEAVDATVARKNFLTVSRAVILAAALFDVVMLEILIEKGEVSEIGFTTAPLKRRENELRTV